MATWKIEHFDIPTLTVYQTVFPENLKFTKRHRDTGDISYQLSYEALGAAGHKAVYHDFIGPKRTGFYLYRNTQKIMGGIHSGLNADFDAEACQISGHDWMWYTDNRHFPFNPEAPDDFVLDTPQIQGVVYQAVDVDYATILLNIWDNTIGRPYSIPFTYSFPPVGATTRWRLDLADTTTLKSLTEALAGGYPGFEWDITPNRHVNLYYPYKYGTFDDANRQDAIWVIDDVNNRPLAGSFTNTGPEGTHILGQGAGLASKAGYARSYIGGQEQFGRWDLTKDYSSDPIPDRVLERTEGDFALALQPVHEIPITLSPEDIPNFWTTFDTGLHIWIDFDLTCHRIDSAQQILQMDCTVSNEGEELVQLGLQQIYDHSAALPGVADA